MAPIPLINGEDRYARNLILPVRQETGKQEKGATFKLIATLMGSLNFKLEQSLKRIDEPVGSLCLHIPVMIFNLSIVH